MLKRSIRALTIAGALATGAMIADAPSAVAGVKIYITPSFPSYGHVYDHNYHGDFSPRCHWERRRVRRKVCWRNSYGRTKCRWKKQWRRVKVCL